MTDACQKYGGFYLGSIGGPAAILAQNNIKSIECVEYPELGMEAIWKIEVEDFPAFILGRQPRVTISSNRSNRVALAAVRRALHSYKREGVKNHSLFL